MQPISSYPSGINCNTFFFLFLFFFSEKVELFSELYGNTLIRQQTLQYLQQKANLFIEMITDLDYCDERMPTIDMSQLKVRKS